MALKDVWQNMKNSLTGNAEDEYDDEYYDDTESEAYVAPGAPKVTAPTSSFRPERMGGYNTTPQRPVAMKVVIVEPKEFEDSEGITKQLRDLRPVVINFENTASDVTARVIDFVSGATFALDGKIEKIGKEMFICVPQNITVDYGDKNYGDLSDTFSTWKEPTV